MLSGIAPRFRHPAAMIATTAAHGRFFPLQKKHTGSRIAHPRLCRPDGLLACCGAQESRRHTMAAGGLGSRVSF
jgi:hypothetical protein